MFEISLLFFIPKLFDEGQNVVSMILPNGVKRFNDQRHFKDGGIEERHQKNPKKSIKSAAIKTTITTTIKTQISKRVKDVEYDEDYIEENENKFNEIPSMALRINSSKFKYEHPEIRDFAIDLWNGSPGLKYWGYNESNHNEYK